MSVLFLSRFAALLALFLVTGICGEVVLDVEVREAHEPYSISVVSQDAMFYGVRTEPHGAVSRFRIPESHSVIVELRFASGFVLARTIPLDLTTGKRSRIALSREDAIFALDLVNESHTVSAKILGKETYLARTVESFEKQMENGEVEGAETLLWELTESQPDSALPWNNLGALRLASGNLQEADEYLRRALQIQDRSFETNLNLSRVKLALGDRQSALKYAQEASRIRKGHPFALAQEASILLQLERHLDARPLFEELLRTDPYHSTYPDLGIAVVLEYLGDRVEAARHVLAWAAKHPRHPEVRTLSKRAEKALREEKAIGERAAR